MAGEKKTETYITSDYANWLPFLTNTQNELNELEKLAASAYLDYGMLNVFFARFKTFMSTRWSYVRNNQSLKEKLERIGKTLFSKAYLQDLNKFKQNKYYENPLFTEIHTKLLNGILEILEICALEFAKHRLLYEVKEQKARDPSKAILEGYH